MTDFEFTLYDIYFRITNNCNLTCRHCCYDCGPGKDTMSFENIKKVIRNLPEYTERICLSGGEIYTEKDLLFKTIDYIKRKRSSFKSRPIVMVQTNGFWIKDEESLEFALTELSEYDVDELIWAGNDKFHKEQGLNIGQIEKIIKVFKESDDYTDYTCLSYYGTDSAIFPFGRSKELSLKDICEGIICLPYENWNNAQLAYLNINPEGLVNICCWELPALILGNAFNNKVDELYENALKNKVLNALINEGPLRTARLLGFKKEQRHKNLCAMCEEMLND